MLPRTLWAFAMLLLFLVPILVAPLRFLFPAIIIAFGALSLWEAIDLMRRRELRVSFAPALVCVILLISDARMTLLANGLYILVLYMLVLFAERVYRSDYRNFSAEVGAALLATMYVGIPCAMAVALMFLPGRNGAAIGPYQILFLIAVVFSGDSAAYIVGSRWGRRPFSPILSPKKSVEGAIASVVVSILFAMICIQVFEPLRHFYGVGNGLFLGTLLALGAPVGDLAESAIKRDAGQKDSSSLIAGHGGFLDVFDALLFCVPLQYVFIRLFLL